MYEKTKHVVFLLLFILNFVVEPVRIGRDKLLTIPTHHMNSKGRITLVMNEPNRKYVVNIENFLLD